MRHKPYRPDAKHRFFDMPYVLWKLDAYSNKDYELPPNFDGDDFFDVWWLLDDQALGIAKRCKWIR